MIFTILSLIGLIIIIVTISSYKRLTRKPVFVSIEGNIGVGKSTLLNKIKPYTKNIADYVPEPVDLWENIKDDDGRSILELFYNDKYRWSYTFQNLAYITRLNNIIDVYKKTKKRFIIMDRSSDADKEIIGKMMYEDEFMNDIEWYSYQQWHSFQQRIFNNKKPNIIYLKCDPKIAFERIKKRGRESEKKITLEYLQSINDYLEIWLNKNKNKYNILVIDANQDFVSDEMYFDKIIDKILNFINKSY